MPQIDLVTYSSVVNFLYILFWIYFIFVVFDMTTRFKALAIGRMASYSIISFLGRLLGWGIAY